MQLRTLAVTPAIEAYLWRTTVNEPEVLAALRAETAAMPGAGMQIGPDQGQFMRWLVELTHAKRCIEIGVYTGYSSISVALGLPDDGVLVACDSNRAFTDIAARYWERARVAHKIRLELGPAMQTLQRLIEAGESASFDFAFIDADKEHNDEYYELSLALLHKGGLLLVDNALWGGRVAAPDCDDIDTRAIQALNRKIASDPRVSGCLLTIGDGLSVVTKR
jgi:predicted O-methyltransferase YrrM